MKTSSELLKIVLLFSRPQQQTSSSSHLSRRRRFHSSSLDCTTTNLSRSTCALNRLNPTESLKLLTGKTSHETPHEDPRLRALDLN